MAKVGRKIISPKPPSNIIDRGPRRAANNPATGIANIEPSPKQSKSIPNWLSLAPTFCFINGISGAQQAMANPAAKNVSRVASLAGAVLANALIERPMVRLLTLD